MQSEIKQKFPNWTNDWYTEYDLVLSDDIDSLLSCELLKQLKGYEINYFYDFEKIYKVKNTPINENIIGVDTDFVRGKNWGNHITISNANANLNCICDITNDNYSKKYCGSTALEIISYYDYDISHLTEEGKMILLAIDCGFKGFYNTNFHDIQKYYLCDVMQLEELYKVIQRHSIEEFYEVIRKYKLYNKIYIKQGRLTTDIELKTLSEMLDLPLLLPNCEFELFRKFQRKNKSISLLAEQDMQNVVSLAFTRKNFVSYTISL